MAGADDALLVRVDSDLHAVAQAEAGQDAGDVALDRRLAEEQLSYQPAARFWPFQWIEGGWLLLLSALLIAAAVWLVSRRAA